MLVLEGYGLSETCAAATLNTPDAFRFGTVGRPLPGTEVAIAADGEILIRGPHVFMGYYNDPAATEETLTVDGWLRSGDLGAIDAHGFVHDHRPQEGPDHHLERQEHHAGQHRESSCATSRRITEAVVFGDNRPYLVAMLTLDRDESVKLAGGSGSTPTRPRSPRDRRVHAEIQKQVDAVNDEVRADRADQALRDPRPRPHPGRRRADADAEGQARGGLRAVRRRVRRSL